MYHVAASIVADKTNSGVTLTAFVAEITSMCGLRVTVVSGGMELLPSTV